MEEVPQKVLLNTDLLAEAVLKLQVARILHCSAVEIFPKQC